MKKIPATSFAFLLTSMSKAQRGGPVESTYEIIGLPNGDQIGESLKIAIPLLIVGFLITYIFSWSKKSNSNSGNGSENIGCFGLIIMAIGGFFLLPLFAWVEFIFDSIVSLGIALAVVGAIIYLVYSAITKK